LVLAIVTLLFIAVLGVIAGTAMASSATVFAGALMFGVVFAVVLALLLETGDLMDEPRNEGKQ
jgi:uncharacterized oligopeptide transporter (OPT) family protein